MCWDPEGCGEGVGQWLFQAEFCRTCKEGHRDPAWWLQVLSGRRCGLRTQSEGWGAGAGGGRRLAGLTPAGNRVS